MGYGGEWRGLVTCRCGWRTVVGPCGRPLDAGLAMEEAWSEHQYARPATRSEAGLMRTGL